MTIAVYLFAAFGFWIAARFCWQAGKVAIAGWKLGQASSRVEEARRRALAHEQRWIDANNHARIPSSISQTRH